MDPQAAAKLVKFLGTSSGDNGQEVEEQIFYQALGSDYFDVAARGMVRTGIHMGAMAGTMDIVQRCFTGIVTRGDVLWAGIKQIIARHVDSLLPAEEQTTELN